MFETRDLFLRENFKFTIEQQSRIDRLMFDSNIWLAAMDKANSDIDIAILFIEAGFMLYGSKFYCIESILINNTPDYYKIKNNTGKTPYLDYSSIRWEDVKHNYYELKCGGYIKWKA